MKWGGFVSQCASTTFSSFLFIGILLQFPFFPCFLSTEQTHLTFFHPLLVFLGTGLSKTTAELTAVLEKRGYKVPKTLFKFRSLTVYDITRFTGAFFAVPVAYSRRGHRAHRCSFFSGFSTCAWCLVLVLALTSANLKTTFNFGPASKLANCNLPFPAGYLYPLLTIASSHFPYIPAFFRFFWTAFQQLSMRLI